MITLKIVPLFGSSTRAKSPVVTVQRRLNVYFENRQDGDKTRVACYGTPGLSAAFTLSTPGGLPVRGMLGTQSALYLVAYTQFQSVNNSGTALFTGSVGTSSGNCSLATNGTQVLVADGATGYIYTPAAATFTAIGSNYPANAKTTAFVAGFFVAEQPGTQKIWASNQGDGSTWGATSFGLASARSDNVVAVDELAGNLIVFSEQHFEPWQNQGLSPFPFVPILSAAGEYGLAAIYSRAHVNESIIFLAQAREGQKQVVQLKGFLAAPISDPDIESIISGFATTSDAVGCVRGTDQHKFYQLTFPTAGRSFLFDTSTGLWCEVQTGTSLIPVRHTAQFSTYFQGKNLLSDYATNQLYYDDPNSYTDNGTTIIREVTTRHVLSQFNRIRVAALYLDMETGVGLQNGQGSNPQIMLQYSKDNGRTWSAERWVTLGAVGQYFTRVWWRRFGSTRDATFKIRMSDPVKFVITEGAMKVRQKRAA